MDAKKLAMRIVERLRKRSTEYQLRAGRNEIYLHHEETKRQQYIEDTTTANSLSETADCIEEALASFDEE